MKTQLFFAFVALFLVGVQGNNMPHNTIYQSLAAVQSQMNLMGAQEDCQAAAGDFLAIMQQCAGPLSSLGNSGSSGPPVLNNTVLDQICQTNCVDGLKKAIRRFSNVCASIISSGSGSQGMIVLDQITGQIGSAFRMICIRSEDQYCYPSVMQSMQNLQAVSSGSGPDSMPDLNSTQLQSICSPCLGLFFKTVSDLQNSSFSIVGGLDMVGALCVKDHDRFCYPTFFNFSQYMAANHDASPPAEYVCDRCFQKVMTRVNKPGSNKTDDAMGAVDGLCGTDDEGHACSARIAATFPAVGNACDFAAVGGGTCSQGCQDAMAAFFTAGGCCAGNAVDTLAKQNGQSFQTVAGILLSVCHLTAPAPCSKKTATFHAQLKNVKYSYYLAHKSEVDDKVILDVASNAGVSPSAVTITGNAPLSAPNRHVLASMNVNTGFTLFETGTSVTTTITTTGDAAAITNDLNTAVTSGSFTFSSVATLPADASIDPTAGAGDAPVTTTSGSSTIQPSLILALFVIILALF